jgi:hypothetical protein
LSGTSTTWYKCAGSTSIWKQIYLKNFASFNPQPSKKAKDWKGEIQKKIKLYGWDFEQYRHLVGNVKINYKIDPPMDFENDSHIHRLLELRVNDQLLPFMGYFGAGDVCYGDWIQEVFQPLFRNFDAGNNNHNWDFCDQGMPAFDFVKEGPICKLSIVEGICGGGPLPDWQNIEFLVEDLRAEYLKFLEELHEELLANYGHHGKEFWDALKLDPMGKKKKK